MIAEPLISFARYLFRRRATAWIILGLAATRVGEWLIVTLVAGVKPSARPFTIKGAQKLTGTAEEWEAVINMATRLWRKTGKLPYLEVLILTKIGSQQFLDIAEILGAADEKNLSRSAILRSSLVLARFEIGDYPGTIAAGYQSFDADPESARSGSDGLYSSYAAGQLRDFAVARRFFAAHYRLIEDIHADDDDIDEKLAAATLERLSTLVPDLDAPDVKTAVFFLSSTQALGHAILDPYHFIALNRDRYDRLLLVGPPFDWYAAPSASCVHLISHDSAEYLETEDVFLINLSWMSLGRLTQGNVDLVLQNYWSLLRDATLRTRDPEDSFQHNSWHVRIPRRFEDIGVAFAKSRGIDLSRPIVTLHARDHGYHRIHKQSYRDVDIAAYEPAIHELLEQGFQVIRLGDESMKRLEIESRDYRELPFDEGYRCELDAFFVSRSEFMIGCQSGPCSFARALGRPLLSINAVYHYTLLPAPREMGAFKHYFERGTDGGLRELNFEEILERKLYLRENSMQFDELGVELCALTADEILAAVKSMTAWMGRPDLLPTEFQNEFSVAVEKAAVELQQAPALPVAAYLGISLPGYRIAPQFGASQAFADVNDDSRDDSSPVVEPRLQNESAPLIAGDTAEGLEPSQMTIAARTVSVPTRRDPEEPA